MFSRAFKEIGSQATKGGKYQSWFSASVLGGLAIGAGAGAVALASGDVLEPAHYPWQHLGKFTAYDSASLRRGFEVYRQVCSTCHSLNYICYRNLVGVTHTEVQAKALAQSVEVKDGPNDEGEMFQRPGRLSDHLPNPYPNEEYARFINGGALPPDLSLMTKARPRHEDYVFALLTGYRPEPYGVSLRAGLYYNPYFPGGAISMPKPLLDGAIEYEDGVEASSSQMAKDVTTFLAWCAEPEADDRKLMAAKWLSGLALGAVLAGWHKRFKWNVLKNRKLYFVDTISQRRKF